MPSNPIFFRRVEIIFTTKFKRDPNGSKSQTCLRVFAARCWEKIIFRTDSFGRILWKTCRKCVENSTLWRREKSGKLREKTWKWKVWKVYFVNNEIYAWITINYAKKLIILFLFCNSNLNIQFYWFLDSFELDLGRIECGVGRRKMCLEVVKFDHSDVSSFSFRPVQTGTLLKFSGLKLFMPFSW